MSCDHDSLWRAIAWLSTAAMLGGFATVLLSISLIRAWLTLRKLRSQLEDLAKHTVDLSKAFLQWHDESARQIRILNRETARDSRMIHERLQELVRRGYIPPDTLTKAPPPLVPDDD